MVKSYSFLNHKCSIGELNLFFNYLDAEKCKNCKHSDQKHYKNCLNCIEHLNFTK